MNAIRPDRAEVLLRELSRVVHKFVQETEGAGADFQKVECAVRETLSIVRTMLVSAGLSGAVADAPMYHCPQCSGCLHPWALPARVVVTAEGEGSYPAVRYRCNSCAKDYYPVEEANGLDGDGYTTGAKGVIGEVSGEMPFARVTRTLTASRGITVSPKEVDRTAREAAQWRRDEEEQLVGAVFGEAACKGRLSGADPLAGAPNLFPLKAWEAQEVGLISVDGAMVRSSTMGEAGLEWFESRTGVIAPAGEGSPGNKLYVSGIASPDSLFDLLSAAWQRGGSRQRPCLFIADGARWIWDRASLYFPKAQQVLDIYHAAEHVASAARACWGEGSVRSEHWRKHAREMLLDEGGPRRVLRELIRARRQLRTEAQTACAGPANDAELLKEIRYLFGHRRRMPYADLKARGLPVGSGAMESGIKQTTIARLRQPGMKWTRGGADAVLAIRSACLTGTYRDTVERKHTALQAKLQKYAPSAKQMAA